MDQYRPGIGICAGAQMLKWGDLDQRIRIEPDQEVNVFINFESILAKLIQRKNLHQSIAYFKKHVVLELESAILNLVANYRSYIRKCHGIPKLYLYHTHLSREKQEMRVYNKYYRTYYYNQYMQNPQFRDLGKLINSFVIPDIELILSYVYGCYFVKSKRFDGSLIPYIIAEHDSESTQSIIVTSDVFDTLYYFQPSVQVIYIKRNFSNLTICSSVEETVRSIIKDENPFDLTIFNYEMYYRLLLSMKGSKVRNIRSAKGFGYGKFTKILKEGLENGMILKEFESIDSILQLFPEKYQEDIKNAFLCSDIGLQSTLLTDADRNDVLSQCIDKVDIASVEALNNQRFLDFPINLPGLLE